MQFIFLSLAFAPVIVTAVDFLEDTNLFSEHASSPVSLDDWDSTDLLDYNENSELNMFVGNDVLDSNISAEKDCTTPPVSGLIGRIRGRTDQCSSSLGAAPQLQLPTLDDLPLTGDDGLVLDSLKNEEICSSLVFPLRNIPICGSGNPLDRKYIARDSGYSLEHCTLFVPALSGCFFADQDKDLYCCSKYNVKDGIGYAQFCSNMMTARIQGGYESLP